MTSNVSAAATGLFPRLGRMLPLFWCVARYILLRRYPVFIPLLRHIRVLQGERTAITNEEIRTQIIVVGLLRMHCQHHLYVFSHRLVLPPYQLPPQAALARPLNLAAVKRQDCIALELWTIWSFRPDVLFSCDNCGSSTCSYIPNGLPVSCLSALSVLSFASSHLP